MTNCLGALFPRAAAAGLVCELLMLFTDRSSSSGAGVIHERVEHSGWMRTEVPREHPFSSSYHHLPLMENGS
jgi:hypothetical protein